MSVCGGVVIVIVIVIVDRAKRRHEVRTLSRAGVAWYSRYLRSFLEAVSCMWARWQLGAGTQSAVVVVVVVVFVVGGYRCCIAVTVAGGVVRVVAWSLAWC
jgi:hypothetical protein